MSLAKMSDSQLSAYDIATLNLFCALGLKGADGLDPTGGYEQVLDWTRQVEGYTRRSVPRFRSSPNEFWRSLPKFKMLCMVTALQRDLGVRYYLPFSEGEYNASDARNLFIHGILSGHGGTCVSMPVLYVAIGRRLGYPLYLVRAKEHFFVRWEGHGERFNIDATSLGFSPLDDEHYHRCPRPLSDQEAKGGYYLRNLTRKEELACFLEGRGDCAFDGLRFLEAVFACHLANSLAPHDAGVNAKWAVATVLQTAIAEAMRAVPTAGGKIDLRTLPMPKPARDWERAAVPLARTELDRIINVTSTDSLYCSVAGPFRESDDGYRN